MQFFPDLIQCLKSINQFYVITYVIQECKCKNALRGLGLIIRPTKYS